jgi:hypothetical protein
MDNNQINPNLSDQSKSFQERIDEVRNITEENLRYTKAMYSSKAEGLGKDEADLKQLIQENLNVTHEIYRLVKKIKRQLMWQKIWGAVKLVIIVVPLVISAIYLYPMMGQMIQTYQQLMDMSKGNVKIDASNLDPAAVKNILNQLKK